MFKTRKKNPPAEKGHHVIVTGYSRSGTTMFYEMLRGSVRGYEFLDRETPAARVIAVDNRNRITKRPLDIFQLDDVVGANSSGKRVSLLILIRDIRSILTSFHDTVPDDYFIGYDHQYFVNRAAHQISYRNPGVVQTYIAIKAALDNANFDKKLIIKYEDLVLRPDAQQAWLGQELDFEYAGSFENFHTHEIPEQLTGPLNEVRPLEKSRIDNWKKPEHAQRIRSQFTRCPLLFDILTEYGYEKDRCWFDQYRREAPPVY